MLSNNFNSQSLLVRPFAPADTPRLLIWAVERQPGFLPGKHKNNARTARDAAAQFVAQPGTFMAVETTRQFRDQTQTTMLGAIGAINTRTGKFYVDPNYQNNPHIMSALKDLFRQHRANTPHHQKTRPEAAQRTPPQTLKAKTLIAA